MSYMTISSQEKHNFSLCSCFHAHPTTLLLKILGGTNAWAVPPTLSFGGGGHPRPPPLLPPKFRRDDLFYSYYLPFTILQPFSSADRGAKLYCQKGWGPWPHGRILRGTGGRSPPNLRWGRPMHPSPNICRISVIKYTEN